MISGLAWGGAPAILLLAFKCEGRPRRIYSGHPRSFPLGLLLAFLKQEFLCVPGVCIQGWYFPVSEDRVLADWVLFVWPCGVARDGFALRWRSVGIACVHSSRFNCNALRVLQFPFSIKGCQTNSFQMLSDAISVLFRLIPQASHVFSNRTSPRGFGVQIAICVCLQLGRRFASEISAILQIQFHASVHWWASCGLFLKNISYCLLLITCY